MIILFGLIGAVLGWVLLGFTGAVLSCFLGMLWARQQALSERLAVLEAQRKPTAAPVTPAAPKVADAEFPESEAAADTPDPRGWLGEAAAVHADPPNAAVTPPGPAVPGWPQHVFQFFTTGNVVAKVGVVVLFFGVGFLVKYAADRDVFPIALRLAGLALGAMAMLLIGWRLRATRMDYGLILQGGAVGLLYLVIFAAFKLYHLLPGGFAFALLVAVVAVASLLAVAQDARSLAIFGVTGGFLAPVLTASGGGSHVALFSYYAILNAGILGIAWVKTWRALNWLGFIFTFVIGSVWGALDYRPEFFATTEPFLLLFFLYFLAISVLFAQRQPPALKGYIDGSLVFGLPAVVFALQSVLVADIPFGRAWSAFALSAIYLLTARALWARQAEGMRTLTEAFLALGIVFLTLAIPFALEGRWTAVAWALEGAGLVWIGVRQSRLVARLFGLLVQIAAGVIFLIDHPALPDAWPVANSAFLGAVLISLSAGFSSYLSMAHADRLEPWERDVDKLYLAWGLAWWIDAGVTEINTYVNDVYGLHAHVLFFSLSAIAMVLVGAHLRWLSLRLIPTGLGPILVFLVSLRLLFAMDAGPLTDLGWLAWPIALAALYGLLRRCESEWPPGANRMAHALSAWLLILLVTWSAVWMVAQTSVSSAWVMAIGGLIPALALMALQHPALLARWPAQAFPAFYVGAIATPLGIAVLLGLVRACFLAAEPAPLPYAVLINPVELTQIASLVALWRWQTDCAGSPDASRYALPPSALHAALGLLGFVLVNSVIGRAVHFYAGVPHTFTAMLGAAPFHTTVSVTWGVLALLIMKIASKLLIRPLWFAGAVLLALLVLKLFFIDLAGTEAIARIVSFIAAGLLMLVIGYLSPLPPKSAKEDV